MSYPYDNDFENTVIKTNGGVSKMKKKRTLSLMLVLCMALTMLFPVNAFASIGHTTKTIDKSKTVSGDKASIKVLHYFTYVVLEEDDAAVKKINKKLKSQSKYLADDSAATDYAVNDVKYIEEDAEYEDYTEQSIGYISENYVSVVQASGWYAGGVSNYSISGLTFDLSTGKQIKKLTDVTKEKSLKKIKKGLKDQALEEDPYLSKADANAAINGKKAKDFSFFINQDGDVVVCFGPYEMGYGGWTRMYTIEGDVN